MISGIQIPDKTRIGQDPDSRNFQNGLDNKSRDRKNGAPFSAGQPDNARSPAIYRSCSGRSRDTDAEQAAANGQVLIRNARFFRKAARFIAIKAVKKGIHLQKHLLEQLLN